MGYYSSTEDAIAAANLAFSDGLFSIQQVTDTAVSLGFYTDAVLDVHVHSASGSNHPGSGVSV